MNVGKKSVVVELRGVGVSTVRMYFIIHVMCCWDSNYFTMTGNIDNVKITSFMESYLLP